MVNLPVDDVVVLLGLLDLLCPAGPDDGDPVRSLAGRLRTRLSQSIADAVETTKTVRSA